METWALHKGSAGSSACDLRCVCLIELGNCMKNRNLGSKDLHGGINLATYCHLKGGVVDLSELGCLSAIGSSNAM